MPVSGAGSRLYNQGGQNQWLLQSVSGPTLAGIKETLCEGTYGIQVKGSITGIVPDSFGFRYV